MVNKLKNQPLTPCIGKCKLVKNKCSGCGRTLDQIKNWSDYSDIEKKLIMKQLKKNENI